MDAAMFSLVVLWQGQSKTCSFLHPRCARLRLGWTSKMKSERCARIRFLKLLGHWQELCNQVYLLLFRCVISLEHYQDQGFEHQGDWAVSWETFVLFRFHMGPFECRQATFGYIWEIMADILMFWWCLCWAFEPADQVSFHLPLTSIFPCFHISFASENETWAATFGYHLGRWNLSCAL